MIRNINNKKNLIISHIADIDGMGSVILAKKYFNNNIDYILCEIIDLPELFKENFERYENIYLCDLQITSDAVNSIENNEYLKLNLKHFDHHASGIYDGMPNYINEVIEIDERKTCGTELFYRYLLTLEKSSVINNDFYRGFVEAVRENDTWDFRSGSDLGHNLASIHAMMGAEPYIEMILSLDDSNNFELPKVYMDFINADKEKMCNYIENADKNLKYSTYNGYNIGISITEQYRSMLGNDICANHPEIDFILIINFNRMSCSLRTIRDDIDLGKICREFHHEGGGHKKAAGFTIDSESIPKIKEYIDTYLK